MSDRPTQKNGRMVLNLNVSNLAESLVFYQQLGFNQIGGQTDQGWAIIHDGENELHLFQGHLPENTLNFRGGDVFQIAELLRERGVQSTRGPEIETDGSAGAWLQDPDGNLIYFNTFPGEEITD